jgi:methionine-gamma-lyase
VQIAFSIHKIALSKSHLSFSHFIPTNCMGNRIATRSTEVVHGAPHRSEFGFFTVPIYHTSAYEFANCDVAAARFGGREAGFFYSRMGNPTVQNLDQKIARLEGSEDAVATSSGISAVSSTALTFVSDRQHILVD